MSIAASKRPSRLVFPLKRRWWLLPIVLLIVLLALAVRELSSPVLVNASVQDGDREVARTDGIFFTFNQDVDVDSVRNGLQIHPPVS